MGTLMNETGNAEISHARLVVPAIIPELSTVIPSGNEVGVMAERE